MVYYYYYRTKEAKQIALVIKSSLKEGIFVDNKCVNCASCYIMRSKKIFHSKVCCIFFEAIGEVD